MIIFTQNLEMKVLLIDFEYSQLCASIRNRLITEGHECLTALAIPTSAIPAIKTGNSIDRAIHRLLANISDSRHLHSARSTYNLLSSIVTKAPDVVHILNTDECYLNMPLLSEILNRFRIPTVMTVISPESLYINRHALIKREKHNLQTMEAILYAWETLNIVVENRARSEHPLFVDKPVYIIESTSPDAPAQYLSLYDNLS